MRFARTIIFAFVASILSFSAAAALSEPPKGFRNLKWGSAPGSGLKKIMGPTSDGTSMYVPAAGKKLEPLFDIPVVEEGYSYSKGKFFSGSSWLSGSANLENMKAALSKVFGPPSFANEQSQIWKWQWPKNKIEIQLYYQAKFSKATVTYLNNRI